MSAGAQNTAEYKNSDVVKIIDEYVHNAKYREVLKSRYIDGMKYEPLAEKHGLSVRQAKNIVYKYENLIFRHIEKG